MHHSHDAVYPNHIAAGCIRVARDASKLSDDQWLHPQLSDQWNRFSRHNAVDGDGDGGLKGAVTGISALPFEIQTTLLKSALAPVSKLLQGQWLEAELRLSHDCPATALVRIYLLPDDVNRRLVDRSDATLIKLRTKLLSRLDFSPLAWDGCALGTTIPRPVGLQEVDGPDHSLLYLFNTIPSPDPDTDILQDSDDRQCSYRILNSAVPGLKTTLYPYQRRSAALMFQREIQPGKILDPRTTKVTDQNQATWYYDDIGGLVLRDPRFYDGIAGGILAEEMGTGKTLICLALIMATRQQPAYRPEVYPFPSTVRRKIGSLGDMAAAAGSNASVPWDAYFHEAKSGGLYYEKCLEAIHRNPGWYHVPQEAWARRSTRQPAVVVALPPTKILLSQASLVIVPTNLLQQWRAEIEKHTSGLRTLVLNSTRFAPIPQPAHLIQYDLILISQSSFEKLRGDCEPDRNPLTLLSPLARIRYKRIIVDEGHKLGNSKMSNKSDLLLLLDCMHTDCRWIVTGTPSTGLVGVDVPVTSTASDSTSTSTSSTPSRITTTDSGQLERKDLERIGAMAALYLKARPWANTILEAGDSPADWSTYVVQKNHSGQVFGRRSVLKATLESLIIRHRKSDTEIGELLPSVQEKIIYLDGSYQDKLSRNLFSAMIIFNSVQSQRTGPDYFFHPRQRKSLLQLVANERQASFFGGSFFSPADILNSVTTAEEFLEEKKVPVSEEDELLLREAIAFGRLALGNNLKAISSRFHEIPVHVENFPGREHADTVHSWSLTGSDDSDLMVCMDSPMLLALQRYVRPWISSPESLGIVFRSGAFADRGKKEHERIREKLFDEGGRTTGKKSSLAGNMGLSNDTATPQKPQEDALIKGAGAGADEVEEDVQIAEALANTRLVSTASAKLSYLLDTIVKHQDEEKILVFYENDNVAWYIAGFLEILHIHHLIYAKSLKAERRAQYVVTFNENAKFRVMLMDLTQAAFGLDMRAASRIYFINPVLNPQVEAQAIGRVRRISQRRGVTVETLVLRGSLEELILERRRAMSEAEHRRCKSILDDKPMLDWFLNARVLPMAEEAGMDDEEQMARLETPLALFGHGSGRVAHPDEDLVGGSRFGGKRASSGVDDNGEAKRQKQSVRFASVEA